MRNRVRWGAMTTASALLALVPMAACDTQHAPASGNARAATPTASTPESAARAALRDVPLGHVSSRDASGNARFIVGARDSSLAPIALGPEAAARLHLERHAALLGLGDGVLRDVQVEATHDLAGGASIVQFVQRVGGVDVFRARASVVLDAGKQLASIASTLHPSATGTNAPAFTRASSTAMTNAIVTQYGKSANDPTAPRILESTSKKVLFATDKRLVAAHYVEFLAREFDSSENQAWAHVVDDASGRTLYTTSLTAHDAVSYRVWADPSGNHIPMDGPQLDYSPHPSGTPDKLRPAYAAPILVSQAGFNTNPQAQPDPWLATGATLSSGNNVHAYTDRDDANGVNDGFNAGDIEATTTAAATFDRVYDVTKQPNDSVEQEKAAVTQIFYTTNWLHDFWYDSGFNEASGVAQLSNLGRAGGVEGDPLRAEAQDGADHGQSNNANMSSFSDGTSPRMQMYVWSGIGIHSITTTPATQYPDGLGTASFGPQVFDVTAPLAYATPAQGCTAPTNVAGKIAVVDRGACTFVVKAQMATAGGAVGIIIVNNAAGHTPTAPGGTGAVTIPVLGISLEDGANLKTAIGAGAVSGEIIRGTEILHDGTIDNSVVAHEWGHYLHHRLVQCGSQSCGGMSEGWADFDALMMVIKDGDTMDGTAFPMAQYAAAGLLDNNEYFGIRRAPYSTSFSKFPFTFKHVRQASTLPTGAPLAAAGADMSEVHNVGEIWAETLFEGYAAMLDADRAASIAFATTKRHMADYVVAGMKATPIEPTFTEQRDAILSTVWAMGRKSDFYALAGGFAKRGMGVGAIAPPVSSVNLNEAVENFDNKGALAFVDGKLDDLARSCDSDGILDANETGTLTVRVKNAGWLALVNTDLKAFSGSPDLHIGNSGLASVVSIDPYGVATLKLEAWVDGSASGRAIVPLQFTFDNAEAYASPISAVTPLLINADDVAGTSATDDVESNAHVVWTFTHGTPAQTAWTRVGDANNHVWHGVDVPSPSEESLVSPSLTVSATAALTIKLRHRFSFEKSGNNYFDGGVLEVSPDNGVTWNDVSTYVDPAYPHTLYTSPPDTNVLAGHKAWSGDSAGYPAFANLSLDLGTQLASKTIKIRFRMGSDDGGSSTGWDIDDIQIGGITNTPFGTIIDNAAACPAPDGGTIAMTDAGAPDAEPGVVLGYDAGTVVADSGFASPDGGASDDTSGSLSGGGCSTSPRDKAPAGAAVGLFAGLFALVSRSRARRAARRNAAR